MKIPKIIHVIWFGESYPDKYKQYLLSLIKLNPECDFRFWCDGELASQTMLDAFDDISKYEERFQICQIRNYPDLANFDLIVEELDKSKESEQYKKIHYVRASDMARISILYAQGGIYLDADTEAKSSFEDNMFSSNTSMLLKAHKLFLDPNIPIEFNWLNFFDVSTVEKEFKYFFPSVLYDFIASVAGHPVLEKTLEITRVDFETYRVSSHKYWEGSCHFEILRDGNIKLTGTALKWALNFLYQNRKFVIENPRDLFFDTVHVMTSHYEKSWLEGFSEEKSENYSLEEKSLDAFCSEIEQSRSEKYSCVNPGNHPLLSMSEAEIEKIENMFKSRIPKKQIDISVNESPILSERIDFSKMLSVGSARRLPEALILNSREYVHWMNDKPLQIELNIDPVINFKLSQCHIDFSQFELNLKSTLDNALLKVDQPLINQKPSKQEIYDVYVRNGGGLLARLSIFASKNNPEEIIETLKVRAAENKSADSASKKTLAQFGIQ